MSDEQTSLDARVEHLSAELASLTKRVEHLYERLHLSESAPPSTETKASPPRLTAAAALEAIEAPTDMSEEVLTWAGKASLLPRLATLCLLLVLALALRTLTDSAIIPTLSGSVLGMGYAAAIILAGWYLYRQGSPLAPVFAACGPLLMGLIVVETHTRFASLPLVPAYLTLMATGGILAFISFQFRAYLPIAVGTLSICLAAAAIDYPHPYFPYLAMVLLFANLLGHGAEQLKRSPWLRWILLLVTMLMLQLWSVRLGMLLMRNEPATADLAREWFFPIVAIIALLYAVISFSGIRKEMKSRFDVSLPTISTAWAFSAAAYVATAAGGTRFLGWAGIIVATSYLGIAYWLANKSATGKGGANVFVFAGAVVLALALPLASGSYLNSLPVISVTAFFLAILSRQWHNGAVRATTYLMQLYASLGMALTIGSAMSKAPDFIIVLPAGLMSATQMFHYQWSRRWPPHADSATFGKLDPKDRSAVCLLLASLVCGFFMLRTVIYQFLLPLHPDMPAIFRCAQTVLINAAAIALMLFAYLRRNREVRNVAVLVTIAGAIKVFLYDLLGTHGAPLVASVFSFGTAAAIESVLLGRWQHAAGREATEGDEAVKHRADDDEDNDGADPDTAL